MIFINIRKQLGDFKIDAKFEAQTRGIVALFGQSGSGKTSIINMIAGLLVPDHGHIEIDGRVLYSAENGTNLKIEHRRVGYVFQESRLFPHMTVQKIWSTGVNAPHPIITRSKSIRSLTFLVSAIY